MANTRSIQLSTVSLLLTAIATFAVAVWQQPYQQQRPGYSNNLCYQDEEVSTPFVYFNTKTAYGAVAGNDLQTPSDCRPMQVWLVSRHGTRNPSQEMIKKLQKLNQFKSMITEESTMCPNDITAIKNWNLNLTINEHNKLHKQGIEDLKSLALRLKGKLPQIFETSFTESKFKFLSSHKERAKDSALVFYQTLFNENPENGLPVVNSSDDRLYLSKCKQNIGDDDEDNEDDNPSKVLEVKKFKDGPLVRSVISRVSMAMGLKQVLSYENITLMLNSCKYEKAWNIQSHPAWCAVFTQRDMEILEYLEDLKYYYLNGYGNPFGESIGCPIVKDLNDNFKNLARDKTGPLGIFYFGHSKNILSVVTRMGIAKDSIPLLSTNFDLMSKRKWRLSFIDPFASNVIAVFYRCRNGNKAMVLLNEHAIPMNKDKCRLCPWEPIEAQLDPITSNNKSCNLDFCKNTAASTSINVVIIIFICTYNLLEYFHYI